MKKLYTQPEWQIKEFSEEDVITTSGVNNVFGDSSLFERDDDKVDNWEW